MPETPSQRKGLKPASLRGRLLLGFMLVLVLPLAVALALAGSSARDAGVIGGAVVLLGIPLAVALSSELSRSVRAITAVAVRASRGEFGVRVDVNATGEVAQLADAINTLGNALRTKVTDADAARAELRDSVRRLGEALRSTHDLSKMLAIVLETALVAVGGKAGAVYLLTTRRNELYVKVGRQLDPEAAKRRLPLGEGLAGSVASSLRALVTPSDGAPVPSGSEPVEATALAVPLEAGTHLVGVLAIYGKAGGGVFESADVDTISSLARQAGVGVENVLLHQEAERLSITDGLTGIWNHRFFKLQLQRSVDEALRFPRPMALLVVDIDDFKKVNDRYGHQRGDAILIEVAQRIHANIRSIDVLARYGGEEFVLILPGTSLEGGFVEAEKIRSAIADASFGTDGEEPIDVTVSIGYAVHPTHGLTPQELLRAADHAMYEAKAKGKNRTIGADEVSPGATIARDPARP